MMGNAIFAGIDLGGTNAKVALFDDQLHQIGEKRAPSRATESADIILENLAALLTGLLKETGTDGCSGRDFPLSGQLPPMAGCAGGAMV